MKVETKIRRVALIGNPNTGKTTLFNELTGLSQRVGNYPGVTVEKKIGRLSPTVEVVDLPGTYSLSAFSPDEMVAARVLLGDLETERPPDLAVVVADAGNLERNLYLVTQVIETGVPTVVALNMVDLAERAGITVDAEGLGRSLGVPVVPTIAPKAGGVDELRAAIEESFADAPTQPYWQWPPALEREVAALAERFPASGFLLRRALVDVQGSAEGVLVARYGEEAATALAAARLRVTENVGSTPAALEVRMRYGWIDRSAMRHVVNRGSGASGSDRADRFLTHRLLGTAAFVLVMSVVFVSIFEWAGPFMDFIDTAFGTLGELVSGWFAGTALEGGVLESFLVNGVITGVGGVLVFLPQIAFLFLFIAILEDCGYLARAAFLMDRLLRFCGLSGHSFIPLLSSFACAVPGIMAARTIRDRRDRIATIVVAPLMSCSARLPVYALLIAAFVPAVMVLGVLPLQGLVFAGMYFLGIVVAVLVALVLKRSLLSGPASQFVMELPPYRWPSPKTVALRVYDRSKSFVYKAGTIIFAMAIVIWALGYFPRPESIAAKYDVERQAAARTLSGDELAARLASIGGHESGEYLRQSVLGRMGHAVEPVVRPLGWDWRIGTGVIAAFPAREVVISTLGIIYDLGEEGAEDQGTLVQSLRRSRWPDTGQPVFSLAVALSLLVFFALCCQCGATVATIKRETNSWRWAVFTFVYMTAFAWIGAFVTYQIAGALGG